MHRVFRARSLTREMVRIFGSGGRLFLASAFTRDAVSGKVASFVCQSSGATLSQSTSAQQVAIPLPHVKFGGSQVAVFAGSQWYDSSDPASFWKPLHDGTGCTWYQVFMPSASTVHVIHSTRLFVAATEVGHTTYINNLTNHFCLVANGAAESLSLSGGVPSTSVPTYTSLKFATASTPDGDFRVGGSSVATGNSGALSSADPGGSLRLGAGIAASNRLPLQAAWAMFAYAPRVISQAEDDVVKRFISTTMAI